MAETAQPDVIFLELREKLQSGLLFIRKDVDCGDVSIESDKKSVLSIQTPLRRFQLNLTPGVTLLESKKNPENSEHGSNFHLRLKVEQPSGYDGLSFARVLPLPNGNWNALVEDWCCHPDPFANRKLLPRDGDCLLGDTFVLLARDEACQKSLARESAKKHVMVSCRSCSTVLGEEITAEVLKLYITGILIKPSADEECDLTRLHLSSRANSDRVRFLEQTVALRLVELSMAQSIFRFSVQTPDEKPVILLWLLNTDTLLASYPDTLLKPGDSRSIVPQTCQAVKAVKVLYVLCSDTKNKDVAEAWDKDISVHPLPLPESSCEDLQKLLLSSTSSLPSILCSMNSYQVAYMRM
ncbi:hypothetical protein DNTS_001117 [Danionella cerebrum]|uniref:E3 ubiquitin-protein ligase E3D n=1 Tax=Danionella cerebrum TaxID=2873325 RepID=A0A553QUK6_9TELE|nr:hypothetical protein DNTS_001117 [Danionella translucida]